MSSNVYGSGLRNVGSYQVSGRPFCKSAAQGNGSGNPTTISFPNVTKQIIFINRGSNSMYVYFGSSSPAKNKFEIAAGQQQTFNVKCKEIYTYGTNTEEYSIYASLTHIPVDRMYALTGPGITE